MEETPSEIAVAQAEWVMKHPRLHGQCCQPGCGCGPTPITTHAEITDCPFTLATTKLKCFSYTQLCRV
jgi:hypothetical protein